MEKQSVAFAVQNQSSEADEEEITLLSLNGQDDPSIPTQIPDTAHQISSDSWLQVGCVLTTGVNSAYILGYSTNIMLPLGWVAGVLACVAATAVSLYASCLVAKLHEYGGKRHIRYRDLAGKKAYSLTWVLQYINLFMINAGFIILAGSALKAFFALLCDDGALKLPYCIVIAGVVCTLFAVGIPHLSALGVWLGVSTFFTLVYTVIAFVLTLQDGQSHHTNPANAVPIWILFLGIEASARDYSVSGTAWSKTFTSIGAIATSVFAVNTGMLPEIQATIRQPIVGNMLKALYFQFSIGVVPMYAITFMGYWAYGSSTPTYLLSGASGPTWLKAFANISAFLQTIISFHIFASPMYEYMDTKFGVKGSPYLVHNLTFRTVVRGGYLAFTTFISALMPFLGDFMSLTGAISTIPLTFILANHMYLLAKSDELTRLNRLWHWLNVYLFGLLSVAATASALRLIVVDIKTYHFFADM
ncbi:hypothetical protein V2J09_013407 [Rumex salicifolius]